MPKKRKPTRKPARVPQSVHQVGELVTHVKECLYGFERDATDRNSDLKFYLGNRLADIEQAQQRLEGQMRGMFEQIKRMQPQQRPWEFGPR
jgi:hypothetical protein